MTTQESVISIHKVYQKYEYLASKYASKINSYEQLSFEYEDLLQEFKLKIYTAIQAYGRKWKKHVEEGYAKPVPIQYYIESACSNKAKDFMKYISNENYKVRMDEVDFDLGTISETKVNSGSNIFVLNGIDVLENLIGKSKIVYSMYLRGYNKKEIDKVIANKYNDDNLKTDNVVEQQKNYLINKYGLEALLQESEVIYSYSLQTEE